MAIETELLPVKDIITRLRLLNPDGIPANRYYAENTDKAKQAVREWDAAHPKRAKKRHLKYERTETGQAKRKIRKATYRARQIMARGSFTVREWMARKIEFDKRCVYCGSKKKKLSPDHWIPLSKGGTNFIANIVPACRFCNTSKCAINGDEFKFAGRTQMVMASVLQRGLPQR